MSWEMTDGDSETVFCLGERRTKMHKFVCSVISRTGFCIAYPGGKLLPGKKIYTVSSKQGSLIQCTTLVWKYLLLIRLSGKYFRMEVVVLDTSVWAASIFFPDGGSRRQHNTCGSETLVVLAVAAEWMDRFKFKLTHVRFNHTSVHGYGSSFCAILTPTSTSLLINYRAILIQQ